MSCVYGDALIRMYSADVEAFMFPFIRRLGLHDRYGYDVTTFENQPWRWYMSDTYLINKRISFYLDNAGR